MIINTKVQKKYLIELMHEAVKTDYECFSLCKAFYKAIKHLYEEDVWEIPQGLFEEIEYQNERHRLEDIMLEALPELKRYKPLGVGKGYYWFTRDNTVSRLTILEKLQLEKTTTDEVCFELY